jgi:hypothetical protein
MQSLAIAHYINKRSPSLAALLLVLLTTWITSVSSAQAAAPKPEAVSYYGVYMKSAKVGSVVLKREDEAKRDGKTTIRTETETSLDLSVMGTPTQIVSTSVSWSDPKSGFPIATENRTESAGAVSTVSATYTANSVSYIANVTGTTKKATLTLKPGEAFLSDPTNSMDKPKVGMKFKGKVFVSDPGFLTLIDSEMEIAAKEPFDVGGQTIEVYKILDKNPMAPSTIYMNEAGDMLRTDSILGMQIRKESKEVALAPAGTKADLLSLVGVKPTGETLTDPRSLRTVRYEIANVTRELPKPDSIQTVTYSAATGPANANGTPRTATVTVTTCPLPDGPTVPLFKSPASAPERLQDYLKPTLYVSSDQPQFKELAKKVVGEETDAAKAAAKISAYVHGAVRPDPSISNLRTAADICRDPRGVCRDYTLLYTAIARAAGLPTKQCVGIAYAGGTYYGHAWPEVWVGTDPATGADRWIALEPTWGVPFADATHIKLAEGELSDFFKVAADLGEYQVKVLEAK